MRYAKWALVFATVLTFVGYLVALVRVREVASPVVSTEIVGAEVIGGPLALKKNQVDPFAMALERKLKIVAATTRPGLKETTFCLGVDGENTVVGEGSRLYFAITPHESGGIKRLAISSEPTGVTGVVHVVNGKTLGLKVFGEHVGKAEIVLSAENQHGVDRAEPEWSTLETAKWFGRDRLFSRYGGPQFRPLGRKEKLELRDGKESYYLYVGSGDRLIFQDRWRVATPTEPIDSSVLMAKVDLTSGEVMSFEGWGDGGFLQFSQEKEREKKTSQLRLEQGKFITDIRVRSNKEISCVIGKKRMVLKEGDWLLKAKSGWHKLKSQSEVEGFLNGRIAGELLVIDEVNPKGHLKGHYFDSMRLQELNVNIPLAKAGAK